MIDIFASAAEATSTSPNSGYGVAWAAIIGGICYARRNKAIGGWLLFYLVQVFFGTIIWIGITISAFSGYIPTTWPTLGKYFVFLLETIPSDIATIALFILAFHIISQKRRNWRTINSIRIALMIMLVAAIFSILLNISGENSVFVIFEVWSALWALAWLGYFLKSKRVREVFLTKEWESSVEKRPELIGGVLVQKAPDPSPKEVAETGRTEIHSDDDLAIARLNVGNAILLKGDFEEAADEYTGALRLNPSLTDAYYGLALCMAHLGKKVESIESLRNAVEKGFNGWPKIENEKAFAKLADDPWFSILREVLRKRWNEYKGTA